MLADFLQSRNFSPHPLLSIRTPNPVLKIYFSLENTNLHFQILKDVTMPPLVEDVIIRRSERLTTISNALVIYSRPNMLMHCNLLIQLKKICMVTFACNAIENFLKKSGLQFLKIARQH